MKGFVLFFRALGLARDQAEFVKIQEEAFDWFRRMESGSVRARRQYDFADFLLPVIVPGAGAFDGAGAGLVSGLEDVLVVLAVIGAGPVSQTS